MAELTQVSAVTRRDGESYEDYFARRRAESGPSPDPTFTCEVCEDTTWKKADGGSRVVRCDCVQVHADGVPFEFYASRFDNYDTEEGNATALAKARAFLGGRRDLFLCGGVGAGKTRLACAVLNEAYIAKGIGWFVRVPMMLYKLQPGTGLSDVDRGAFEHRLFNAPLIVLDDLGVERDHATDFTRRTLYMVYEQRGDRGLRTIWTSNKTPNELKEMHDDTRLASRIVGRCDVVRLSTADQRMARRGK